MRRGKGVVSLRCEPLVDTAFPTAAADQWEALERVLIDSIDRI